MARKLVNTKDLARIDWLEYRAKSIGGSDAAALMDMSSWQSPLSLYLQKTQPVKESEGSEAMRLGNDLEEYVAQRFTEASGKKVRKDNYMWMHDDYDFITANVDRVVVGENAGLECKTMGSFNNYDLENGEVPAQYYCQCQHYMMVMGWDRMYLGILVLQKGFYWLTIERNEEFIEELLATELNFWNGHVVPKLMPAPDGSESSMDALKEIFPRSNNQEQRVSDELIAKYRELGELIKTLEVQQEEVKQQLCAQLGDAGVGVGIHFGCSWKNQSRTTVDAKKLKAEYPEIYLEVSKTTENRAFRTKKFK
jgi:putative phage-type endonuclease